MLAPIRIYIYLHLVQTGPVGHDLAPAHRIDVIAYTKMHTSPSFVRGLNSGLSHTRFSPDKRPKDLLSTCQVSDLRRPCDTLIDWTLHGAHEDRYMSANCVVVQDLWVTLVLAYTIPGGVFVLVVRCMAMGVLYPKLVSAGM